MKTPPIVNERHVSIPGLSSNCPNFPPSRRTSNCILSAYANQVCRKAPRKLSPIAKLQSRDQEEKPAGSQSAKTSPRSWWKGIPCNSRTQQHLIRGRRNSPLDPKVKQGASFPVRSLSAHSNVRLHSPPLGLSGSEDTAKGPSGYWEQRS